jgi:hypothetical protein
MTDISRIMISVGVTERLRCGDVVDCRHETNSLAPAPGIQPLPKDDHHARRICDKADRSNYITYITMTTSLPLILPRPVLILLRRPA